MEDKPCIVHNDMNLSISKLSGLFYETFNIYSIEHIPRNRNRLASAFVDGIGNLLSFRYSTINTTYTKLDHGICHLRQYQILRL